MFNYNVNWSKVIKENLPIDLQKVFRITWVSAIIAPFKQIYSDFLALRDQCLYKIRFNSQIMYLEKILNDKFDPINRQIYIDDGGPIFQFYVFKQSESQPPLYLYRKWNNTTNYLAGEYAVFSNGIYKALSNNTNVSPLITATWIFVNPITFLRRKSEFNLVYNFIVHVPVSVTFNNAYMRSIIDYYRFASKRYQIVTF